MEGFDVFGDDDDDDSSVASSDDDGCCGTNNNNDDDGAVVKHKKTYGPSLATQEAIARSIRLKEAPPLYHIIDSSEKNGGKGLEAAADIAMDMEILRERPLVVCPNGHPATCEEEALELHKEYVEQKFQEISRDAPEKYELLMSLFSLDKFNNKDNNDDDNISTTSAFGIYQTNSVQLTGRDAAYGAVFPTMCRMNHSCRNNTRHEWREDIEKIVVLATRDIPKGEELYINYGAFDDFWNTNDRREFLQTNFGFHCLCERCQKFDVGCNSGGAA